MVSFLMLCLTALCSLAGCILLALSQKKHVATVFGRGACSPLGRATRPVGWILLFVALIPAILGDSPDFALLYWLLSISGSAMIVMLLIAWKPEWLKQMARTLLPAHPENRPDRG